jgi:hypothetical protein
MDMQEQNNDGMTRERSVQESRRNFLKTAGRFAVYTPPAVMLLMKPSFADTVGSAVARPKGNNGLGNGFDGQPPGNPPINDGPGTSPGNPGNRPR